MGDRHLTKHRILNDDQIGDPVSKVLRLGEKVKSYVRCLMTNRKLCEESSEHRYVIVLRLGYYDIALHKVNSSYTIGVVDPN